METHHDHVLPRQAGLQHRPHLANGCGVTYRLWDISAGEQLKPLSTNSAAAVIPGPSIVHIDYLCLHSILLPPSPLRLTLAQGSCATRFPLTSTEGESGSSRHEVGAQEGLMLYCMAETLMRGREGRNGSVRGTKVSLEDDHPRLKGDAHADHMECATLPSPDTGVKMKLLGGPEVWR